MPTWDEITPYLERDTRRWNAVNVLIVANISGLVLSALAGFLLLVNVNEILTFNWELAIKRGWVWQFLTYTFWHPIGLSANSAGLFWALIGIALGCYILHTMGRELEHQWGWRRFTVFYLATGVYGAVAHALYQAVSNSPYPGFDFLGPVLAVFLITALRAPDRRILLFFFFQMRMIVAAWVMIGIVVLFTLAGYHAGITPVATLGAVASAYVIYKLEPKVDAWLDVREQRVARERFLDEFELKREVDGILDKINREGIGSLSSHERKMLKRASRIYTDGRHE